MKPWKEIEVLIPAFKSTFGQVIDFDRFNSIVLTFHSTAIEGSTLSLSDAELLLDKGLTPKGKPVQHQQMVLDHHQALLATLKLAESKTPLSTQLIQDIAGKVMKNTGAVINTVLGSYDSSKGDLRLNNVRAGNQYFINYDKVKPALDDLVSKVNQSLTEVISPKEVLELAFTAHLDLVMIHPFADGNGYTSRLLMNYIQHYHGLPISPVYNEDRQAYIQSLNLSQQQKSIEPFHEFMAEQYVKYLQKEISNFQTQIKDISPGNQQNSTNGFSLIF